MIPVAGAGVDSRGRTRSALPRRPAHTDYQRDSYGVGEDRDDTA